MTVTNHELLETIKNGPIKTGECLLVINHKTYRIGIQSGSIDFDYEDVPRFTINGIMLNRDSIVDFYKSITTS